MAAAAGFASMLWFLSVVLQVQLSSRLLHCTLIAEGLLEFLSRSSDPSAPPLERHSRVPVIDSPVTNASMPSATARRSLARSHRRLVIDIVWDDGGLPHSNLSIA